MDVLNNLLLYLAWQELESGYPWVSILPQISQDISVLFMATELTGINTETLVNKLKGSYVDTMKNKANLVFLLDSIITKIVELDYEDKKSWARTISVLNEFPGIPDDKMKEIIHGGSFEQIQIERQKFEFNYLMSKDVDPIKVNCGLSGDPYTGEKIEQMLSELDENTKSRWKNKFGRFSLPTKELI